MSTGTTLAWHDAIQADWIVNPAKLVEIAAMICKSIVCITQQLLDIRIPPLPPIFFNNSVISLCPSSASSPANAAAATKLIKLEPNLPARSLAQCESKHCIDATSIFSGVITEIFLHIDKQFIMLDKIDFTKIALTSHIFESCMVL